MSANGHSIHNNTQEQLHFIRKGVARRTPERHHLAYMPQAIRNGAVDHIPKRKFFLPECHLQIFHITVTVSGNYGTGFLKVFEGGFSQLLKRFILAWWDLVCSEQRDDNVRQRIDVFQGLLASSCLRAWFEGQIYGAQPF